VTSGTAPGTDAASPFEIEGAAFVEVVAGKATEWRLIIDSRVMEDLAATLASEANGL
jgi:hypothetical protein